MYQPKTGERCHCRPGIQRDNCPACERTGQRIDFKAIREKTQGIPCANMRDFDKIMEGK